MLTLDLAPGGVSVTHALFPGADVLTAQVTGSEPPGKVALRAVRDRNCGRIDLRQSGADGDWASDGIDPTLTLPLTDRAEACVSVINLSGAPIALGLDLSGAEANLTPVEFCEDFEAVSAGAHLFSESDFPPFCRFGTVEGEPQPDVTIQSTSAALGAEIEEFFHDHGSAGPIGAELLPRGAGDEFLYQLEVPLDPSDADFAASAEAWRRINRLLSGNLTGLRVIKYGPGRPDGTLRDSAGVYLWLAVGRSAEGAIGGVLVGAVET